MPLKPKPENFEKCRKTTLNDWIGLSIYEKQSRYLLHNDFPNEHLLCDQILAYNSYDDIKKEINIKKNGGRIVTKKEASKIKNDLDTYKEKEVLFENQRKRNEALERENKELKDKLEAYKEKDLLFKNRKKNNKALVAENKKSKNNLDKSEKENQEHITEIENLKKQLEDKKEKVVVINEHTITIFSGILTGLILQ